MLLKKKRLIKLNLLCSEGYDMTMLLILTAVLLLSVILLIFRSIRNGVKNEKELHINEENDKVTNDLRSVTRISTPISKDTESKSSENGGEDLHTIDKQSDKYLVKDKNIVKEVLPPHFVKNLSLIDQDSIVLSENFSTQKQIVDNEEKKAEYINVSKELYMKTGIQLGLFQEINLEKNTKPIYFSDSWYFPYFKQNKYDIDLVQGKSVYAIIKEAPVHSLSFISVRDDGSQALKADDLKRLRKLGFTKISPTNLRSSYVNIIQKTDKNSFVSLFEMVSDERIGMQLKKGQDLEGVTIPIDIDIESGGAFSGNISRITLNSKDFSKNHRGMNIVQYDIAEDKVITSTYVDTFVTTFMENTVFCARPIKSTNPYSWAKKDQLVSHGLGGIDGLSYSNCLEAFLQNYQKGLRIFEVDLSFSLDGYLVARHDWEPYLYDYLMQEFPDNKRDLPLSRDKFKELKIFKQYTPLDFEDLCQLMGDYKDVYLVTDTKSTTEAQVKREFSSLVRTAKRVDPSVLNRIIPQFYNEDMLLYIRDIYTFQSYIYTLYQTHTADEQVIQFIREHGIKAVTLPTTRFSPDFIDSLGAEGVYTYIHTLNTLEDIIGYSKQGVYGFYSDHISPEEMKIEKAKSTVKKEIYLEVIKKYLETMDENVSSEIEQKLKSIESEGLKDIFNQLTEHQDLRKLEELLDTKYCNN
jgi:glycerophosphoryl diester phosphodiesterase